MPTLKDIQKSKTDSTPKTPVKDIRNSDFVKREELEPRSMGGTLRGGSPSRADAEADRFFDSQKATGVMLKRLIAFVLDVVVFVGCAYLLELYLLHAGFLPGSETEQVTLDHLVIYTLANAGLMIFLAGVIPALPFMRGAALFQRVLGLALEVAQSGARVGLVPLIMRAVTLTIITLSYISIIISIETVYAVMNSPYEVLLPSFYLMAGWQVLLIYMQFRSFATSDGQPFLHDRLIGTRLVRSR